MKSTEEILPRILVVDDDSDVLGYLSRILTRCGYTAVPASTPQEALSIVADSAADHVPSLAIVDVVLGDENGIELADALVARAPELRVLLISGYVDRLVHSGLGRERMFFLPKIFSPQQLKKALQEMSAA